MYTLYIYRYKDTKATKKERKRRVDCWEKNGGSAQKRRSCWRAGEKKKKADRLVELGRFVAKCLQISVYEIWSLIGGKKWESAAFIFPGWLRGTSSTIYVSKEKRICGISSSREKERERHSPKGYEVDTHQSRHILELGIDSLSKWSRAKRAKQPGGTNLSRVPWGWRGLHRGWPTWGLAFVGGEVCWWEMGKWLVVCLVKK